MFLLTSMICSSSVIPAFAAEGTDGSDDPVIYQTVTGKSIDKTPLVDVKASIKSSYEVTLPKTITVNNGDNAYTVNVKGDIGGKNIISVVPDSTVNLASINKNTVTCSISQKKEEFTYADVSKQTDGVLTGTDAAGNININDLTAGHWSGTFNFNIALSDYGKDVALSSDNITKYGITNTGNITFPSNVIDENNIPHKVATISGNISGNNVVNNIFNTNNNTDVTSITVGDGVLSIRNGAFYKCKGLTSVNLPESLTYIGKNVFDFNNNLESITLPDNITQIDSWAFGSCYSLKEITLPKNLKELGFGAFVDAHSLSKVVIPDSIKKINDEAFIRDRSLSSVTYKGTTYTSKSELISALSNNGVIIGKNIFKDTALQE